MIFLGGRRWFFWVELSWELINEGFPSHTLSFHTFILVVNYSRIWWSMIQITISFSFLHVDFTSIACEKIGPDLKPSYKCKASCWKPQVMTYYERSLNWNLESKDSTFQGFWKWESHQLRNRSKFRINFLSFSLTQQLVLEWLKYGSIETIWKQILIGPTD